MGRTRVRYRRVVAIGALGASLVGAHAATASTSGAAVARRVYVVRAGDSIWSIASSIAGRGDPRPVVDELIRRNGIRDARIWPGERLMLGS